MKRPPDSILQQRLRDLYLQESGPQPPAGPRGAYERIFTPLITLWYLVFQRLHPEGTLAAVVLDALGGGADALATPGKEPSQKLLSSATPSYSDARQRLPEAQVRDVFERSAQTSQTPPDSALPVQLMDGTLLAMLATPELIEDYPPASNQHGASAWCQMRCVAAFEVTTGQVRAAAQASPTTSEQGLVPEIFRQSAPGTLSVGDRNFGVYSVLQAARHHGQHVLVRLTDTRAYKQGGSSHWRSGQEQRIDWSPSPQDTLDPQASAAPVAGRLIFLRLERPGFRPLDLWLLTTLLDAQIYPPAQLAHWYGLRWRAEACFRYLKSQLHLRTLSARSSPMARKEFYATLIAYNLICEGRARCARLLQVPVNRVSFQAVRRALYSGLLELTAPGTGNPRRLRALLLPTRTKARPSEPRRIRERPRTYPRLCGSRANARLRASELDLLPSSTLPKS